MHRPICIIGIDPGTDNSGVILITEEGVRQAYNMPNEDVYGFIGATYAERALDGIRASDFHVVIEDFRPYKGAIVGHDMIKTIKFTGILEWRLKHTGNTHQSNIVLIPRSEVKQWVFLQFRALVEPEVLKNIERARKRGLRKLQELLGAMKEDSPNYESTLAELETLQGKRLATPTFHYVDDRIVQRAMRDWWKIPMPTRVGERSAYGLSTHSWQALGLASYYIQREKIIL